MLSTLVSHRHAKRRAKEAGAVPTQDAEEETADLYTQVATQLQSAARGEYAQADLRMRQWARRGKKPGKSFLEIWEEESPNFSIALRAQASTLGGSGQRVPVWQLVRARGLLPLRRVPYSFR